MKKVLFLVTILCVTIMVAGISYASVDKIYEAAVINLNGDVQVDTKASGTWVKPWIGMKLMEGALIKTGPGSWTEIVFDAEGLNVLLVKENSQIEVNASSVDMPEGGVLATFGNLTPGSSFVVKTPNAACGIRGSGMGVDFIKGMTVVSAFDDKVFVTGFDEAGNEVEKEIVIPEGWKTQVEKDGNTEPPAELSENEKKIFDAWVDFVVEDKDDKGDKGDDDDDDGDGDTDDDEDSKDLDDVKKEEEKKDVSSAGEECNGKKEESQ